MPKLIAVFLTIALVLALVVLGYHALAWVRGAYSELESDAAAFLVVAASALLLCSLIVASALRSLGQARTEARRWLARAEAYELCLELVQRPDEKVDAEARRLLERRLALHAGQTVLKRFRAMREEAAPQRGPSPSALDELLQAIRRDLGRATFGLRRGDLGLLLLPRSVEQVGTADDLGADRDA